MLFNKTNSTFIGIYLLFEKIFVQSKLSFSTIYHLRKQSQKRTGFDYWLGEGKEEGVQGLARLEVSGILRGTKGQINQRLKEKMRQTQKSDNLKIPAYIVIVDFSQPIMKIKKR